MVPLLIISAVIIDVLGRQLRVLTISLFTSNAPLARVLVVFVRCYVPMCDCVCVYAMPPTYCCGTYASTFFFL